MALPVHQIQSTIRPPRLRDTHCPLKAFAKAARASKIIHLKLEPSLLEAKANAAHLSMSPTQAMPTDAPTARQPTKMGPRAEQRRPVGSLLLCR